MLKLFGLTGLKSIFNDLKIVPQGVWGVGLSNLFINLSTIFIFSLYGVYLVEKLGVSPWVVGVMDGFLQSLSLMSRIFSGMLSDFLRKRRLFLLIGYGLAAISRPILAFAPFLSLFMLGHTLDRLGNGMQAAPRDALIGDIAPKHFKGECYGLRQTLAIIGSILGPILIIPLMYWSSNDYQFVFLVSGIPAVLGFIVVLWMVREPKLAPLPTKKNHFIRIGDIIHLSKSYWLVIGLSCFFTLARFGETFLIMRGKSLGLEAHNIPLVMLVMNIFNSLAAYPFGRFSDSYDRRILLALSFATLIAADLVLGFSSSLGIGFIGIALWGIQIGATTSLILAMIADTARPDLRATAFGIYYLAAGFTHIVAGLWAGLVWDYFSPEATYVGGAIITTLALIGIAFLPSFKPKDIENRKKF